MLKKKISKCKWSKTIIILLDYLERPLIIVVGFARKSSQSTVDFIKSQSYICTVVVFH
jgi:hypothetical protein